MKRRLFVILLIFCCLSKTTFGSIKIDSVKVTASTCQNNGSITVYVTTNDKLVLYSIVSGPVTEANQTDSVFSSLPPGSYTIQVTDGASETAKKDVTISGGYTPLNFSPVAINPHCIGTYTGQIIGNPTPGTGRAPFTWQLIAPSPVITQPQTSDTLNNLPAGIYTVRVTDACGNYSTASISIVDPSTFIYISSIPLIQKVGCDSVVISFSVAIPVDTTGFQRLPLTFSYQTKNGVYTPPTGSPTTQIDTSDIHSPLYPQVFVKQLLKNITYGDYVNITAYNACNDSCVTFTQLPPYTFNVDYNYNCDNSVMLNFTYTDQYGNFTCGLKSPVSYTVTNMKTNKSVADSIIIDTAFFTWNPLDYFPVTQSVSVNTPYHLKATDGCGLNYQATYSIPSPQPPSIDSIYISPQSCIDSVAFVSVKTSGLRGFPMLIFLSGPPTLGSSKSGFSYSDSYSYPDTIYAYYNGYFTIANLGIGKYKFMIVDGCNNTIYDSLIIKPTDVESLQANVSFKNECSGQSIIYLSYLGSANVTVQNITTGIIYPNNFYLSDSLVQDSVPDVPPGKYAITFAFNNSGGQPANSNNYVCDTIIKIITIPQNQAPVVSSSNSIICKDSIHVQLVPDSSLGVPPYEYEIISGPQKFPVQSSNVFAVTMPGNYTARIFDACGDASITQITVDTLSFPPINTIAEVCANSVKLYYGSSVFYTYTWSKGNFQYIGDTLNIPFVTSADTGIYSIRKVVNIDGCTDTFHTNYNLYAGNYFVNNLTFCKGNTVTVGKHTYTNAGTYIDTLLSVGGCDSIIQSNIAYLKPATYSKTLSNCDSIVYNGITYRSSMILNDTIKSIGGCDSVYNIINIEVNSIVPVNRTQSFAGCNSYTYNGTTYKSSTILNDTIRSIGGCDSIYKQTNIIITNIAPVHQTQSYSGCNSYTYGGKTYSASTILYDTLRTISGCDSVYKQTDIVVTSITPVIQNVDMRGCNSIEYEGNIYTESTIVTDTLRSKQGCDSIYIVATINVTPIAAKKLDSMVLGCDSAIYKSIVYKANAVVTDTIKSYQGCDSIYRTASIVVTPNTTPSIVISGNDTICLGATVTFSAIPTNGGSSPKYYWAVDGIRLASKDSTFTSAVLKNNDSLGCTIISNADCLTIDSAVSNAIKLVVLPTVNPSISITASNNAICIGNEVMFTATAINGGTDPAYQWQINNSNGVSNIDTFVSSALNDGDNITCTLTSDLTCVTVKTVVSNPIEMSVSEGNCDTLFVPTAFDPFTSVDLKDQTLRPFSNGNTVRNISFRVYNRYGNLVFASHDLNSGWDGRINGTLQEVGTFVWTLEYVKSNGKKVTAKGTSVLIY